MKELSEDGIEYVDGRPVEAYEMRFTGSILLTPDEAASISAGDLVSLLVTARAQQPTFKEQKVKNGPSAIKRVNPLKLNSLTPLSHEKAQYMYDSLGAHIEGVNEGIVEVEYQQPQTEQELGFNPEELF